MTGTVQSPGLIECVCGVDIEMFEAVAIDKAAFAYSAGTEFAVKNNDGFKVFAVCECAFFNRLHGLCYDNFFHRSAAESVRCNTDDLISADLFRYADDLVISRIFLYSDATHSGLCLERRLVRVLLPYTPEIKRRLALCVNSAAERNRSSGSVLFCVVLDKGVTVALKVAVFLKRSGIMVSDKRKSNGFCVAAV